MKTEAVAHPQKWEDIVFEHRNKDYGAYFNRQSYSKHVVLAVLATIVVFALVIAAPTIKEWLSSDDLEADDNHLKNMTVNLDQPPPITPNQPPPPDVRIPPPVKTIIKFLPPKVTEKEVVEEEEMPTIEEIKQNETGSVAVEGTGEVVFEEPVQEIVAPSDEDVIFTVVEQQAEFTGGYEAMAKFLQKNLKYPAAPRRMGIEGSVFVGFVVDREGNISDISIVKGIHADCDKEAIRVVKMMPPWKPGKQNGRAVKSRFVLPIKFKLAS
ncbi:MAG TPA: energy transducer TonB [Ohtaekwangia sp.]